MKPPGRFIGEESIPVEEATETAVDGWKVLLNRMFEPQPIPTQEEEHDDDNN